MVLAPIFLELNWNSMGDVSISCRPPPFPTHFSGTQFRLGRPRQKKVKDSYNAFTHKELTLIFLLTNQNVVGDVVNFKPPLLSQDLFLVLSLGTVITGLADKCCNHCATTANFHLCFTANMNQISSLWR